VRRAKSDQTGVDALARVAGLIPRPFPFAAELAAKLALRIVSRRGGSRY